MVSRARIGALAIAVVSSVVVTEARVTRIEILTVESVAPGGRPGASVLPYEKRAACFGRRPL